MIQFEIKCLFMRLILQILNSSDLAQYFVNNNRLIILSQLMKFFVVKYFTFNNVPIIYLLLLVGYVLLDFIQAKTTLSLVQDTKNYIII